MKKLALLLALSVLIFPLAACAGSKEQLSITPCPPALLQPETENEPPMSEDGPSEPSESIPDEAWQSDRGPLPDARPGDTPAEEPDLNQTLYLLVEADGLHVRTGAGTGYPSLGQAQKNTLLALCGEAGGWYETRYRGETAYVSGNYVREIPLDRACETAEEVISEGCRRLGTPYVYGAVRLHDGSGRLLKNFTAEAFDCSSLMQYIFYRGASLLLDVTTRTQVKQGTHVRREDVRRGDLMFFTNASRKDKSGLERVGHVALYLGEGYILHTASDFAKIEKLSPLRESYFLEARRFFG